MAEGVVRHEAECVVEQAVEQLLPKRGRAILPGEWSLSSGLAMHIPQGWEAWEGLPGDIRLLQLEHPSSGLSVNIYRIINLKDGEAPIRRPDCEWIFKDAGQHVLIPALRPARASTCIGIEGNPMVVQVWIGEKADADFAVEAIYPQGRVVGGRQIVEPLVSGLRWR